MSMMSMECGLEAVTAVHVIHDRNFDYELGTFWQAKIPVVDPPGFNLFHYHLTSTPYIWYFHKYYIWKRKHYNRMFRRVDVKEYIFCNNNNIINNNNNNNKLFVF